MMLEKVILKNFRSYKNETEIPITDSITTFIGKNDAGKSSVFEALDIFFENSKIEPDDACVYSSDMNVCITCVFNVGDENIIIDDSSETTLKDEFLLTNDGKLHITKCYNCNIQRPYCTVYATAQHPVFTGNESLLYLNNSELKKLHDNNGINDDIDRRSNVSLRRAIRDNLEHENREISINLDKEDAKNIWSKIQQYLPVYALFRADRPSQDGDEEVINPLKIAVKQAVKDIKDDFNKISDHVKKYVEKIAENTLSELKEMVPALAEELKPDLSKEPAWHTLFKYTFSTDHNIPLNKRGSGVRRLIVLNFFRAEAKRRLKEECKNSIIYAIEEPETSQHPNNQNMLVEAFKELSYAENTQILLSTHLPTIAREMPVYSIRYITKGEDASLCNTVTDENDDRRLLSHITYELGLISDCRIRVLVYVEGPNDVSFIKNISTIMHNYNTSILNIANEVDVNNTVAFIPMGGSLLKHWINKSYLEELRVYRVYIFDNDSHEYRRSYQAINEESSDYKVAYLTKGNAIENYITNDADMQYYHSNNIDIDVEWGWRDNVPKIIAKAVYESSNQLAWDELSEEKKGKKIKQCKNTINKNVAKTITYEQITTRDDDGDIKRWLDTVKSFLEKSRIQPADPN